MYGQYGRPIAIFEAYNSWVNDPRRLEEADSKADFAQFLYGPVRQSLWHGYSRVQPQYRRYARIESAPDFRERRLRGLNGLRGFGYVGDHGEYPRVRRTERPPAALVIDTYGGVYEITRQAVINDDSGELLNRNPSDLGYEAGRFIAEAVIAHIESNPNGPDGNAMYSSGRGNEATDELSEQSLAVAISAMEDQLDDDGNHIHVTPEILVVKSALLQWRARRILGSQVTGTSLQYSSPAAGTGTTVFDKGTLNPLTGVFPAEGVVRDPFFTDSNDWYLFANPADVPSFAIGFFQGREEPFIGLKDPGVRAALGGGTDPYDFEFDEIAFKVRSDFGVAPVDPRGTYRSRPS